MNAGSGAADSHVADEQAAWEEGGVYERQDAMRHRLEHIFRSPNSLWLEEEFDRLAFEVASGADVLEIGCSDGQFLERLHRAGAKTVTGLDLSPLVIEKAKSRLNERSINGTALCHDANVPLEGRWDLIVGRAVLHHLNYRDLLPGWHNRNLNDGGRMIFLEPMGSNTGLKIYHRYARGLHTEDERPFYRSDIRWMRKQFPGFRMISANLVTLPVGTVSSLLFHGSGPDNVATRVADRIDRQLTQLPILAPSFRTAVFVFDKQ